MIRIDQLLGRVTAYGYGVQLGAKGPELVPGADRQPIPTPLMNALREYRDAIIEYLSETCPECARTMRSTEERERLRGVNPWCPRAAAKAVTDGTGAEHAEQKPCPYRSRGTS